jgi:ribosomal protein S18 acetylase RimI-like enzyme
MLEETVIRADYVPAMREALISLLREYEASLDISLCFQDVEDELARFPEDYQSPGGALIYATGRRREELLGMVGVRRLDAVHCEMKRLYVRPAARGRGLGRALVGKCLGEARRLGYGIMRLDTLADMKAAQRLYGECGFREIGNYNASPDTYHQRFFELRL